MSMALRVIPISRDWSDAELVAEVRRGSDAAFAELYSRYSQRIGSYVHGMVRDHGRAEDITQEIFIAALRRMRQTERPIAFRAWIYEIAKNACIDNFRRSRRAEEVSLDADEGLSSADRGRLTAITTLDAALDNKQTLSDLQGAFGGLSESHHEILVLRELEGRSYSDIGQRLGMSRPVVESTLFRARRRLAEEYEELSSGRRCEFVRKTVDSGPQYSLGIRDRRRMARHFAHCQACRTHARRAGFDESILNMPGVAVKIAALSPLPLMRARWGALWRMLNGDRGRPSLFALRSIHSLARSSDQIFGAGTGAGRGATTAAAIVLASVGGGIATVASSQPARPLHRSAARVTRHGDRGWGISRTAGTGKMSRGMLEMKEVSAISDSVRRVAATVDALASAGSGSGRVPALHRVALPATAPPGSGSLASPGVPAAPTAPATETGAAGLSNPETAGGAGAPASGAVGAAASPSAAGAAVAGDPNTTGAGAGSLTGGGSPTATPQPPVVANLSAGSLPTGTVAATLAGVTTVAAQLPTSLGAVADENSLPPIAGTPNGSSAPSDGSDAMTKPAAMPSTPPVGYSDSRGVAQPGSAHRSGR
jgi:RNA polymerase sigma factor (sigma-70 family)